VRLTVGEIVAATGGELLAGDTVAVATSFHIDSRVLLPGGAFVALIAERDGHEYVNDAFARGASVAIVTRAVEGVKARPGQAMVRVGDALEALAALGRLARDRLSASAVVAITGSSGKTATKNLTAAALAPGRTIHASPGSFNNEWGVPLSLLGAEPGTDAVVLEMGARFAGNLTYLCEIARPQIGVVTNLGLAHAEFLGGSDGVARVKGELVEALLPDGVAVLNADDELTGKLAARTRARVITVGFSAGADVRIAELLLDEELRPRFRLETPWGALDVELGVRGEHQAVNAAMAAAVALELGVAAGDIAAGLASCAGEAWRMELVRCPNGVLVLNDAYNANPSSMAAAIRSLGQLPSTGRRIAVLGGMRELGEQSAPEHAAVGRLVGASTVDVLVVVGHEGQSIAAGARRLRRLLEIVEVPDADAARDAVRTLVRPGDVVLVKGSRAVGLERVASSLAGAGSGTGSSAGSGSSAVERTSP
jgi:UDP-N-acetylmuramoyl-tripeptide--D-alanyl-D-alanine ligase